MVAVKRKAQNILLTRTEKSTSSMGLDIKLQALGVKGKVSYDFNDHVIPRYNSRTRKEHQIFLF